MLSAPFLKRMVIDAGKVKRRAFPFNNLVFLSDDFEWRFENPVTIIVGENGSGKSTLIEALAQAAGFSPQGGSDWHQTGKAETENALTAALRLSWLPKVSRGFFFRAESFFNFQTYIDTAHMESGLGSRQMHYKSHGEAFLEAFEERLSAKQRAIYFLDEPEAALSPQRQLAFLRLMRQWQLSRQVQAVIATHSPLLMSLPDAELLALDRDGLRPTRLEETEHYRITRTFLANPVGYFADLFKDLG